MGMLFLPVVDTHYPNMVKNEIVLTHTHNRAEPQKAFFGPCGARFTLGNAAGCIFSDITQETGSAERFPHFLCLAVQ